VAVASLRFRPPWWATVALAASCAAFFSAGMWQLDRAGEKRRLFRQFDASEFADALTQPVADDQLEASRYRPMRLAGRYDAEHQFLLDVMVHNGVVGYHVLTPLRRDGVAVLVNRGWVGANPDRTVVPDISIGADDREVSGLIAPLPTAGLHLEPDATDAAAPWPRRLTFPSAEDIRGHLDYEIASYQLLLDPRAEEGFARDWRPELMSPENHLSYAVQWFGLAAGLFIIYVAVNLKRTTGTETRDETG